jgi:hypothetical protein
VCSKGCFWLQSGAGGAIFAAKGAFLAAILLREGLILLQKRGFVQEECTRDFLCKGIFVYKWWRGVEV